MRPRDPAVPEASPREASANRQVIARVASAAGGVGSGSDRGLATRGLPPGSLGAATLLGIQRTAGNRAATGLVAQRRQQTNQGPDPEPPVGPVQRNGGEPHAAPLLSNAALTRAQAIRGTAQARLLGVSAYNTIADRAIAAYRDKRTTYATRWGRAWERHNTILSQAGEEAATENLIEGVVIGAVASVVVAAAGAVLFPGGGCCEFSSACGVHTSGRR